MLSIKMGARLAPMQAMAAALVVADQAFSELGANAVVTSGTDGRHSRGSLHYVGLALDFRTRHIVEHQRTEVANTMKANLGPDFDVVLEQDHIHVEYQPKEPN